MEVIAISVTSILLRKLGSALQESLPRQGARGGDTSDDELLPELSLNICLVSEELVLILASGVGTLAIVWATVVLFFGGFSAFLHVADLWVIRGIVFVQAAK